MRMRKIDGRARVSDTTRLYDQGRTPVQRTVEHTSRLVIAGFATQKHRAAQAISQVLERAPVEHCLGAATGDGFNVAGYCAPGRGPDEIVRSRQGERAGNR